MSNDIIIDTLDTLIALLQRDGGFFLPSHRGEAERIARAAWAGDKVYIAKMGEERYAQMSARDRAIRRDFARGASVSILSRRYQLSERRVRCIVQPDRADPGPAEPTAQAIVGAAPAATCLTDGRAPGDAATQRPAPRASRAKGAASTA